MHQFGWLSERGGNLNLLQKEGVPSEKGGGGRGVPTLEETVVIQKNFFLGDFDIDEIKFELRFN